MLEAIAGDTINRAFRVLVEEIVHGGKELKETPRWIKDAFDAWVSTWGWDERKTYLYPYNELIFDVGESKESWPLPKLLGKLWHSKDVMPSEICERLDVPEGSTYARGAQKIMMAGRRGKFHIPRSGYRVPF